GGPLLRDDRAPQPDVVSVEEGLPPGHVQSHPGSSIPSPPVALSPAISDEDGMSGSGRSIAASAAAAACSASLGAVGSSSPRSQPSSISSIGGAFVVDLARAGVAGAGASAAS